MTSSMPWSHLAFFSATKALRRISRDFLCFPRWLRSNDGAPLESLPQHCQAELECHLARRIDQDPCVSRKRKRDTSQVLHSHSPGNGNRRHLDDVHRPLADDMAAQYFGGLAVGDQFAEANLVPVNDRARR